jgi:hypothetical protein
LAKVVVAVLLFGRLQEVRNPRAKDVTGYTFYEIYPLLSKGYPYEKLLGASGSFTRILSKYPGSITMRVHPPVLKLPLT